MRHKVHKKFQLQFNNKKIQSHMTSIHNNIVIHAKGDNTNVNDLFVLTCMTLETFCTEQSCNNFHIYNVWFFLCNELSLQYDSALDLHTFSCHCHLCGVKGQGC